MAYTPTAHPGRHVSGDQILLIVLALLAAAAVVAVATGTWTLPTVGGGTEAPTETSAATYEARVHAAETAEAGRQLQALRNVVVSNPTMAAALAEDITTLELVVTGQLPVEAVQTAAVTAPAAVTRGLDASVVEVRAELQALRDMVRTSPSLESVYHDRILMLDAISDGLVPVEAAQPAGGRPVATVGD